jgi:molecular chaperone IbpA
MAMRNLNLSPFWRSSVGFDRVFDLIENDLRVEQDDNYPPYNIVRTGENDYRISLALAGFKPEQVEIVAHQNMLTVSVRETQKNDQEYLYRGIAGRPFERRFDLADYVQVKSASFEDGLLHIDLVREVPDAMKPRRIQINDGTGTPEKVTTIEQKRVA